MKVQNIFTLRRLSRTRTIWRWKRFFQHSPVHQRQWDSHEKMGAGLRVLGKHGQHFWLQAAPIFILPPEHQSSGYTFLLPFTLPPNYNAIWMAFLIAYCTSASIRPVRILAILSRKPTTGGSAEDQKRHHGGYIGERLDNVACSAELGLLKKKDTYLLRYGELYSKKTIKAMVKAPSLSVGRGEKQSVAKGGGLTAKGRRKYNRATGSHLKAPAPHPKTKKAKARRKSFARGREAGRVPGEKPRDADGIVDMLTYLRLRDMRVKTRGQW